MDQKSHFSVRLYRKNSIQTCARRVRQFLIPFDFKYPLRTAQSSLPSFPWVTPRCDCLPQDRFRNCPTRGRPTAKTSQTRIPLVVGNVTPSRGSPWLNYFPLYLPLDASLGALKFSDQRESLKKEHSVHIVKLTTKMPLIKPSNEGTLLKTLMLH